MGVYAYTVTYYRYKSDIMWIYWRHIVNLFGDILRIYLKQTNCLPWIYSAYLYELSAKVYGIRKRGHILYTYIMHYQYILDISDVSRITCVYRNIFSRYLANVNRIYMTIWDIMYYNNLYEALLCIIGAL